MAIGGASNMGAVGLKLGIALNDSRSLNLILPLHAQIVSGGYFVSVGLGVQYYVEITKNLYLTPRASLGYTASIVQLAARGSSTTAHLGNFTPELGLKYIFSGRVNLGVDLVSIPIFFDKDISLAYYRLQAVLGVNF